MVDRVVFTLQKANSEFLELEYEPLPFLHTRLWLKGIAEFLLSGKDLTDNKRLLNLNPEDKTLATSVTKVNRLIDRINSQMTGVVIPQLRTTHLQDDINFVHVNFVENDRGTEYTRSVKARDWYELNGLLHALESEMKSQDSPEPHPQIFIELYGRRFDLPEEAYPHFTVKETFGFCYANYPHVGRHVQELFYAEDNAISDHHIVPMRQIAGGSRLWFGNTMSEEVEKMQMQRIKIWFEKNDLASRTGLSWGDPHLAIGWLPVAQLRTPIRREDLAGAVQLKSISLK